jgi:phosphatidylglycerol:prolipoprotein diacylglycerol transferase
VLFYNTSLIWTNPLEIFQPWHGGMSFHGALIAVTLALVAFSRRHKVDLIRLADLTAPCVPFGLFFGRIANFINGELWGRPTTLPWGVVFPRAGPEPRHPSELYEAGLEGLALFLILRAATHGAKLLPRRGAVSGLFLTAYALFRISLETVREPDRGMPDFPFGLTMGIILSVPMLAAGAALILASLRPDAVAAPDLAPLESGSSSDAAEGADLDVQELPADPALEFGPASFAAARPSHDPEG